MNSASSERGRRGCSRGRPRDDGWEDQGGYMNAKRKKLKEQFEEEAPCQLKKEGSGSKIFNGVTIHVNGYTKPSSDELKRMMMLHGGAYEHYLYRTRVTHVIATNLPDSKVKELRGLKVVKPDWITESIAAGKLLSYTKYLLYSAKSGLQQGLHTFTVRQESDQSNVPSEKITNSESFNTCRNNRDHCDDGCRDNSEFAETSDDGNPYKEMKICDGSIDEDNCDLVESISHLKNDLTFDSVSNNEQAIESGSRLKHVAVVADTNVSPSKAGDPKFLNEYYHNSRLHYLSTWKAELKTYVNQLQSKGDNFPGRENLKRVVQERETTDCSDSEFDGFAVRKGKSKRCVMHIDMDCFFVSVGLRKRPNLRGKPIAVTHSRGKGAKVNPDADFNFEKKEWALKRQRGRKKGKQIVKPGTKAGVIDDDSLNFPDESDSDSGDDVAVDVTAARANTDTFHSMAEIASCSYEARKAGVRNGMFMGQARKICPELQTMPYDFEGYNSVSRTLYDTVASFTHDIEAVSCDEMLVDCTDLLNNTGATPLEFATLLRAEIYDKTGCSASAGLASNILLAKMATKKAKPNGQFHLTEGLVEDYIKSQTVNSIPGVGWSLTKRFEAMKVMTCGDLQKVTMDTLRKEFGPKTGQSLYSYCRGQDNRPIKIEQQRKSVSAEVNYGIRFTGDSEAVKFVQELSEEVCGRLRNINMKGKTVTLKLMVRREDAPRQTSKFMGHGICNNFSKSVMLPLATDDARIVGKECVGILKQQKAAAEDLRGIGIQIQRLESADVGNSNNLAKNQSILNFTVAKNNTSSAENASNNHSRVSDQTWQEGIRKGNKENIPKTQTHSPCSSSSKTDLNQSNGRIQNIDQSLDVLQKDSTVNHLENVLPYNQNLNVKEVLESSIAVDDECRMDLVEQLGKRQIHDSILPPLPCLPDIKTPDSSKKPVFRYSVTPETTKRGELPNPGENDDYFPSPSQVDPDVLSELPPDIREQIEKEMKERRQRSKPKTSVQKPLTRRSSAPGCSHWQPEKGVNTNIEDHSQDAIVPLPSPSQLDLNCLNALPESLQNELRAAYAKQETEKDNNMLKLQQAKSPSKSPYKRSPSKNSPSFKVPRGRPRGGGGRKKGSSKKLLFKDQTRIIANNKMTKTAEVVQRESFVVVDEDIVVNSEVLIDSAHFSKDGNSSLHGNPSNGDAMESNLNIGETIPNQSKIVKQHVTGVNLCGAVELKDVRTLIKEWIFSTEVPQSDDEEILIQYLQELILDKNLEQVDLVLKFMYRNINKLESSNWLLSLKRIFLQTQSVVQALYGSTLCSIIV